MKKKKEKMNFVNELLTYDKMHRFASIQLDDLVYDRVRTMKQTMNKC